MTVHSLIKKPSTFHKAEGYCRCARCNFVEIHYAEENDRRASCGEKFGWPHVVVWSDDWDEVDCKDCLERREP